MTSSWSINGRFLSQPFSGVQRYAAEITRELDVLVTEHHPLARDVALELLVPPDHGPLPELKTVAIRRVGRGRGHIWEQTSLPREVTGGLLSLGNTGPLAHAKQIVCVHDLNTRVYPQSYSFGFRALYRVLTPLIGRRARFVTTVSNASAAELLRHGIVDRARLRVIPNGHEHALRWQPAHSAATRKASGPRTIVVLGSPAPHKNIAMLLSLAPELDRAGLRLAIAGMSDSRVFKDAPANSGTSNVDWLGRLSDNEIAALLQNSLCLAFPSYVEGFGLPAVEAMSWGCPVIASDRASLPQICGDAALYAPPDDPGAWRDQIFRLASDEVLRAACIEKGRAQIGQFRWRRSAELYLQAINDVDKMR